MLHARWLPRRVVLKDQPPHVNLLKTIKQLQEALPILARRLRNLRIDGTIEWKSASVGIWGPARLPLRFDPEQA